MATAVGLEEQPEASIVSENLSCLTVFAKKELVTVNLSILIGQIQSKNFMIHLLHCLAIKT